jgi:hypothetical protein
MRLRSLIMLCALAGTAAADDDDDEEGDKLPPLPDREITLSLLAHNGMLGGVPESGVGPNLEVALGDHRVQYFVEGSYSTAQLGRDDDAIHGRAVRGGAGVRWLARSFEIGRNGAIDMHLEGFGGVERMRFDGMSRLWRPDLGVGVGYQVRGFWKHNKRHVAFRVSARLYFAPTDRDVTAVCRGTCEMSRGTDNSGIMALVGIGL